MATSTGNLYLDPLYTDGINGSTHNITGEVLEFGVNAFNNQTQANNALVTGGTIFVTNWGTAGLQGDDIRPGKPASIVAQGPTYFSVVYGGSPTTIDNDVTIVVENQGTPQGTTPLLGGGGSADNKWVFNGNVYVTLKGGGPLNTAVSFPLSMYSVFNGDLLQINIENKSLNNDYWLFRNVEESDFANLGKLEVNISGVTTYDAAKWTGIFQGNPSLPADLHVELNISNSLYLASGISGTPNDWSIGLTETGDQAGDVIYDVHLDGATIAGWISGLRTDKGNNVPNVICEGTKTLYIDGTKTSIVDSAVMFHHIVIDANASLIAQYQASASKCRRGAVQFMASNSSGQDSITINVADYDGMDKMVLSAPCFMYGQREATLDDIALNLTGNDDGKYAAALSLTRGAFIVRTDGDVYYNADYTVEDNGLSTGNSFVLMGTNAFSGFDDARIAIDDRATLGLDRCIFVTGGEEDNFYTDGYSVTFSDGAFAHVFGTDDETASVDSVQIRISGGSFDNVAVAAAGKTVSGNAFIEVEGGGLGRINGSKNNVNGASTLLINNSMTVEGSVEDFDSTIIASGINLSILGNLSSENLSLNGDNVLTVDGAVSVEHITVDVTGYNGESHILLAAENGLSGFDPANITVTGGEAYSIICQDNMLSLVSSKKKNTYLNASYTESTTGQTYRDIFLTYGFNAFSNAADALANLGDGDCAVVLTGGVLSGSVDLQGRDMVSYGTEVGSITGANASLTVHSDLTAEELTGFSVINLNSASLSVAGTLAFAQDGHLNIDVTGFEGAGNNLLLLSAGDITNLDESDITITGTGASRYKPYLDRDEDKLYLIRNVYADPDYSEDVDGTVMPNGDILFWGINAFSNLNEAVGAVPDQGDLYISGFSASSISIARTSNLHVTDTTASTLAVGSAGETAGDINVTIENSFIAKEQSNVAGDTSTHAGNISVLVDHSMIGDRVEIRQLRMVNNFTFTGESQDISLTVRDSWLCDDINMINKSRINSKDAPANVTMTFDSVKVPAGKWFWVITGSSRNVYANVTFNIFDSEFTGSDSAIAPVQSADGSTNDLRGDVTFNLRDVYMKGRLTPNFTDGYIADDKNNPGTFTVNVLGGSSHIVSIRGFHAVNISADSTLTVERFEYNGTITIAGRFQFFNVTEASEWNVGAIHLLSGGTISGPIRIGAGTTVTAEEGSVVDFDISGRNPGSVLVRDLSVFQDIPDYTVTVFGLQENGSYALADGANDFSKAITIRNSSDNSTIGTISVGETRVYQGRTYSLTLSATGRLSLNIHGGRITDDQLITAGKSANLYAGENASGMTVSYAATVRVYDHASINGASVSGGTVYVSSGGIVDNCDVADNGTIYVSSGGIVRNIRTDSYGLINVYDGGLLESAYISGGYYLAGPVSVFAGGIASSATVVDGAWLEVYGTARDIVLSGSKPFFEDKDRSDLILKDGGYAENVTVRRGGWYRMDAGVGSRAVLESEGIIIISSALLKDVTVNGGTFTVCSGASAEDVMWNDGIFTVSSGGSIRNLVVKDGNPVVSRGAVVRSATVSSGGSIQITSGGKLTSLMTFEEGAVVSAYAGAVLELDISQLDAEGAAVARINNYSNISGKENARYELRVSGSESSGTYVLANNVATFDQTISVYNTSHEYLGTLSVGGTIKTGDRRLYSLNLSDETLYLNVNATGVSDHIYLDPLYTEEIDGTVMANGDILRWGINTFSDSEEAFRAVPMGGTLFVNGLSSDVFIPKHVNVHMTNIHANTLSIGPNNRDMSTSGDIDISIENSTVSANDSYVAGNLGSHGGDIHVLVSNSEIGDDHAVQEFRLANEFEFTGESQNVSLTIRDSVILSDIAMISNSSIGSAENPATVTLTLERVTVPRDKWFWVSSNAESDSSYANVVFNLSDSTFGDGRNSMSIAVHNKDFSSVSACLGDVTFNVNNIQFNGNLFPVKTSGSNTTYFAKPSNNPGTFTFNVTGGSNYVAKLRGYDVINIAADSILSVNEFSDNKVLYISGELQTSNINVEELHLLSGSTISGPVQINANNVFVEEGSVVQFDISGRSPYSFYRGNTWFDCFFNNLSIFQNIPDFTLSVCGLQRNGQYTLARNASDFNKAITVINSADRSTLGTIEVDEEKSFLGQNYYLFVSGDYLMLNISGYGNTPLENVTLTSGQSITLSEGQAANGTTVTQSGGLTVSSGGTAYNTILQSNGSMLVSSSGTASVVTVNFGGRMDVSSGGTATEIRENGGYVDVKDGADVTFVSHSFSGTVLGSASATVHSGTTACKTIINNSNGHLNIYSGGSANDAEVKYSGWINVYDGGTANIAVISSGGRMYVYTGGKADQVTVNSGGSLFLGLNGYGSGGSASRTVVNSGGSFVVSYGGIADHTTINNWGMMYVSSGGTATSTTINDGGRLYVSYGSADAVTVNPGGSLTFYSGTVTNIVENGGYVDTWNMSNTTVSFVSNTISGQIQQATVHSGTTAINAVVGSHCGLFIHGGLANNTRIDSWGSVYVSSGGTANNTTNSIGQMFVSQGYASSIRIYGQEDRREGDLYVSSGGFVEDVTIEKYGDCYLSSGASADRVTVNANGCLEVSSGGRATNVLENGGYVVVENGAEATFVANSISDLVLAYDSATVHSGTTANNIAVQSSGLFEVHSGGTANNIKVSAGGTFNVYSHGFADSTVVYGSGALCISGGTAFNETKVNVGGTLKVLSGGKISGKMNFMYGAIILMDDKTVMDFDLTKTETNGKALLNNWSLVQGTPDYTITINGELDGGLYKLAEGAEDFDSTITVQNSLGVSLGTLMVGETLTVDETKYMLRLIESTLALEIELPDTTAPTVSNIQISIAVPTNLDVVITADFTDDVELKSSLYRIGETGEWSVYVDGVTVSENGTVYFKAVDARGNESEIASCNVSNIDRIAPMKPTASADISDSTNTDVFVSAVFSDDSVVKEYSFDGQNWFAYTDAVKFTENGSVFFRGTDAAGNVSDATSFLVGNIDKTAPEKPFATANTTDPTNQDVTVTAEFSSDSVMKQYSVNAGQTWLEYTEGIVFSQNGTVYFRAKDEVGNVSGITIYAVTNIDKIAPIIDLTGDNTTPLQSSTLAAATEDGLDLFFSTDNVNWTKYEGQLDITANGTYYFKATDAAGNTGTADITIGNIDRTPPEKPGVSADITAITNQDVTVTATFSADSVLKEYSLDGQIWNKYTNGIQFTQNGSVSFRGTDAAGNVSEVEIYTVSNIDKIAPEKPIATSNTTDPTNQDVTVTAEFSSDSVVKQYSVNAGQTWLTYTDGIVFEQNGTVYFRGMDEAGNVSEITSYAVTNIDKIAPEKPVAVADVTAITNGDVTITATFSDDSVKQEYSLDGTDWKSYTDSVTLAENGTAYFRGTDAAGNVSEAATYTVSNIDKVAPEKPVATANITAPTRGKVAVTAAFSEDSVVKEYSLDGQNWKTYIGAIYFIENGNAYFRSMDTAGNISDVTVCEVSNIDTVAPIKPTAVADITTPTNGDVTVEAIFSDDTATKEYSFDNWTWMLYSEGIKMMENGAVFFRGADAAGNVSEVERYVVSNIDKVAPEKPIVSADSTSVTNGDVLVSAAFSEDTAVKQYSLDGLTWLTYTDAVKLTENGTISFCGMDAVGNESEVVCCTVGNIDKVAPSDPAGLKAIVSEQTVALVWNVSTDDLSGIKEYVVTYSLDGQEFTARTGGTSYVLSNAATGTWNWSVQAVDIAGNESAVTTGDAFEVIGFKPYTIEYSSDNFEHVIRFTVTTPTLDAFRMPTGTYQLRVRQEESNEWLTGNSIETTETDNAPQFVMSDADGNADVFFANAAGIWEAGYLAQHVGSINDWTGTNEYASVYGKNKLADIIEGSTDANILLMTDDENGDALFVDDIYTALPGSVSEHQARIARIDEIRAGAGADIVDMTSQQFEYIGEGLTIRGGAGNDTIWANKGDNFLFGDAGNDRIVGASGNDVIAGGIGNDRMHGGGGNDVFTFCDNWGADNVEQLADGTVTLWFASGNEKNWNASTLTYMDGDNSVKVSGVAADKIALKFGDDGSAKFATLSGMGAFFDATSERIFEESGKGILAKL